MSEQLEQDLRTHAFDDCGEREVPTHIANIAADTLKRYRDAFAGIIEAIENSDDAEAIAIAREQLR